MTPGPPTDRVWDEGLQPERTFLAWQRTNLSLLAATVVVARLVALDNLLLGGIIAGLGLLIVSAITVRTQRRYRRVHRVLHAGDALPGGRANLAMTGMLLLAGLGALAFSLL